MVWYSYLSQNFSQCIVIHTVKGFGIVNKAEVDIFLELSCFFNNPADVGNLISGSSAFSNTSLNIWKFMIHVLLKGFPCGSAGKESTCTAGDLGWEDPLEKEKATHSNILSWRIPWTVQSMGSQRVMYICVCLYIQSMSLHHCRSMCSFRAAVLHGMAQLPRLIMANLSQPESFFATRARREIKVFLSIITSDSLSVSHLCHLSFMCVCAKSLHLCRTVLPYGL